MAKKHQINIITAQPNEKGWRAKTTKSFKLGTESKNYWNTFWKQKIVEWNDLEELYQILEPYIKGTHPEAYYSCLMYGQFRPGTDEPYGTRRTNNNIQDTPHNYLILDIETDSPKYEETCLDLSKVRKWLIDTYPWITDKTGMILYQTASAGVVRTDGSEKHKQIRVRAIMETTSIIPLQESDRKHLLRPFMKRDKKDMYRHIDKATHEKARLFFIAPPLMTETRRLIEHDDICCLQRGEPIDFESLRESVTGLPIEEQKKVGVTSSAPSMNKTVDVEHMNPSRLIKENPPEWHWDLIQEGARYDNIFNCLCSAYVRDSVRTWRNKLLADPSKLGNRGAREIDYIIKWIEDNYIKDFDKPTDKIDDHNVIDIPEYRLSIWKEKTKNSIEWKDKGVVLQKLLEGAGKTESLKELFEIAKANNQSFLYIAPNTKTVVNTCKELGLTSYEGLREGIADIKEDGTPRYPHLGVCLPSLEYCKGTAGTMKPVSWNIVVVDEIEQALIFAVDNGGCIKNPEMCNAILRQVVEKAELVVGMDARLSNLSLQCLETWRVEDKIFDIYTQSKVKPWNQRNFTMVDSTEMAINYIREAVYKGKRVAVVSELDRKGRGLTLETAKDYIEQQTGKRGWAVDQNNKNTDQSNRYINELGKWTEEGLWKMGELEKDLKNGTISHMWASPVLQSAWSYISEECPFDLVVGLYPNSVLTAPNIVQHISRFRTSTEYVMYINQFKRYRPHDIYQRLYSSPKANEGNIVLINDPTSLEFNARHEMNVHWDGVQIDNRQSHFIEIVEQRGGNVFFDYTKITDEHKELSAWLKENHEKAWQFLRSPRAFNIYKKYEDVHDI